MFTICYICWLCVARLFTSNHDAPVFGCGWPRWKGSHRRTTKGQRGLFRWALSFWKWHWWALAADWTELSLVHSYWSIHLQLGFLNNGATLIPDRGLYWAFTSDLSDQSDNHSCLEQLWSLKLYTWTGETERVAVHITFCGFLLLTPPSELALHVGHTSMPSDASRLAISDLLLPVHKQHWKERPSSLWGGKPRDTWDVKTCQDHPEGNKLNVSICLNLSQSVPICLKRPMPSWFISWFLSGWSS